MHHENGDPQSALIPSTLPMSNHPENLNQGCHYYVGRSGKKDKLVSLTIAEISYFKFDYIHIGGQ